MIDTQPTEATAQRILAAAIEEVRSYGLSRVTVVAVARRAAMT
nr:TetR/AcrR family transcriptional regulator [Oxalobacteraceae bacterium]